MKQYKVIMKVEMNQDNVEDIRMYIDTDSEMYMAYALRKLRQAVDMQTVRIAQKKAATGIVQPSQNIKKSLGLE